MVGEMGGEPYLEVRGPDDMRLSVVLRPGETLIGRDPLCDVVLELKRVSRRHAVIRWEDGVFMVQDLGSTNGTLLNDDLMSTSPRRFEPGDCVTVSPYEIRLIIPPVN